MGTTDAVRRGLGRTSAAAAIAALFFAAIGSSVSAAPPDEVPGNNGTVKIHDGAGEPSAEVRNEPHVCTFHLHFFFADAGDSGTWEIQEWSPGDKGVVVLSGTYMTDASGEDRDPDAGTYSLPDGHYKLFWDGDLDTSKHDKHKVFWVDCPASTPTPTPTPDGGVLPTETPVVTPTPTPVVTPTPTPTPDGGVLPTETPVVTPTPTPDGGVLPTETPVVTPTPAGGVAGVTATPRVTLPPTDATAGTPSAGRAGLSMLFFLLAGVMGAVAILAVPKRSTHRS